jgi:outer membrane protein
MSFRPGSIARKFAAMALAATCSISGFAQTPAPPSTPQTITQSQEIPPLNRPLPTRSVGLETGKETRWTLRDAILAALEKNVDIDIERENVRLATFDITAAQGFYDLVGSATIQYTPSTTPNIQPFTGTDTQFISRNTFTSNFGVQQFIERTGGNYSVFYNNSRTSSNTALLSRSYDPNVNFQFTQPLLQNRKIDSNRRQIKIAKKRLDLSDALFRQRAIEIIAQVQRAYWDLSLSILDEGIQREAVKLAETQLRNTQRQVEVGTLAPIDVVSTATQLESRRQQVFQAMNAVAQAENSLKALTVEGPNSELWTSQIVPVEPFEIQPFSMPLGDALKLAFENRPELKQFQLQKDINKIDLDFFKDQLKPQINLIGGYTMIGTAGTAAPGRNVVEDFTGGYFTALGNLFGLDSRRWSVGLQINFPFRNRTAKANYGRALETSRQIDMQARRQLQNIEVEVRNAVQLIETAQLRIDAARAARIYAEQQLAGENKRFDSGMSSTFLILTRQNELSQAKGVELRALADYNKAVADLQRIISTTLSSNSIEVKSEVQNVTK